MPYWRLSGFYLFYFAALGALIPYWGLYLQSRGFDPVDIGQLMAALMATKIIAPNIWGWIADHTGRRMAIVRLGSLLSLLIFIGVFWADSFWILAMVMVLFGFFWNASLPLFEAVTLSHLGDRVRYYSRIRLWGSIGFILSVAGLGAMLDGHGAAVVPLVVLSLYLMIWIMSLAVPEKEAAPHVDDHTPLRKLLRRPAILAFLAVGFLMQLGHGVYYTFYSIYLESHGYSNTMIGQLWALGVVAEVLIFLVMHRLLHRFDARQVLMVSLLLAVLRWMLIGNFPDSLWLLLFAQTLHAATFGTFHAAAMHLVHHYFKGRHQGRGQAIYNSLSFGAGGAVGSLYSGYLWSGAGPAVTYGVSAGMSLLAFLIAWKWIDKTCEEG
ncbi:Nucleoside:H+ symporter:Major facilitator superfamily [hydrothermal vent metagenome]|uniref:Nucleoside:H+ symporter:Major facilitator superfamily n=1 Tax=hydrothermal vent metagenome TaxID=652676 RepID=A0A3B1BHK0_9ZZZZ